jgi:hypothetical protein
METTSNPLLHNGTIQSDGLTDLKHDPASKNWIQRELDSAVVWIFKHYCDANILLRMENDINQGLQLMQIEQLLMVINTLVWLTNTSVSDSTKISVGLFIMVIAIQALTVLLKQGSNQTAKELRFAFRESPQYLFVEITKSAELNIMALAALSILCLAVQMELDLILFLYLLLGGLFWMVAKGNDQYIRYSFSVAVFISFAWIKYCLVKSTTFTINYYSLEVPVNLSLLFALYVYIDYLLVVVFFPAYLLLLSVQYEIDPNKIMEKGDKLSNYTLEEFIKTFASPTLNNVYFTAIDKKNQK